MPYQFVPFTILLFLSAGITLALAIYGSRQNSVAGTRAFVACMAIGVLWSLTNALEISAITLEHKLFWANIQYIAYSLAPVIWLIMVFQFSGRAHWITRKTVLLMLVIPAVTIILVWTDNFYGMVRYNIVLDSSGTFPVISKEYGPWFWVHFAQAYLFNLSSFFLLLKTVLQKSPVYRYQARFLLAGIVLIDVANLLYVFGIGPVRSYDISAIVFSLSGVLIAWGIYRFRLFDLVPIARDNVIEAIASTVIVVDNSDRVVDVNLKSDRFFSDPSYKLRVGDPITKMPSGLGDLVSKVNKFEMHRTDFKENVDGLPRHFEVHISPIKDHHGSFLGRVIMITDITELKVAQEELIREQRELAVVGERDRMSRDLHDNLGQILSFASVQIQAVQRARQRGNMDLSDSYLERLKEIVNQAHYEIRSYVHTTRLQEYTQGQLSVLLHKQISQFNGHNGTTVSTSINGDIDEYEFSGVDKMHVVNIVKEALNNAMKHAQASLVRVTWRCEEGWHEFTVRDDGRGFTANTADGLWGSGLDIMEERVSLLGGYLEIDSALGEYTQIALRFPVR